MYWGVIGQLGGSGQTEIEHFAEKGARGAQAVGDVVGTIEVRIHDQSFPSDGGARFFEIHAHDDHDPIGDFFGESREALRIVAPCFQIVDRAGADDEKEAFIIREDDAMYIVAGFGDEFCLLIAFGMFTNEFSWRRQGTCLNDIDVGSLLHRSSTWSDWLARGKSRVGHFKWTKKWPAAYP